MDLCSSFGIAQSDSGGHDPSRIVGRARRQRRVLDRHWLERYDATKVIGAAHVECELAHIRAHIDYRFEPPLAQKMRQNGELVVKPLLAPNVEADPIKTAAYRRLDYRH
jgi:hypothetical protein